MTLKAVLLALSMTSLASLAEVIEPPMVKVPAGTFMMGSEKGQDNEKPVHEVSVGAFYVGKYEVTVREFRQFVEATGFKRAAEGGDLCWTWDSQEYIKPQPGNWDSAFNAPSEFHPVMCITIDQAQAYVDWLSESTGKSYRLLTEAEWEYAARANSQNKYFFGDDDSRLCQYGNVFDKRGKAALARDFELTGSFKHASCDDGAEYTSMVGMYQANEFGLYDTIGNVGELVVDCEHTSYQNAPDDGSAWITNCDLFRNEHTMVISRGGAYGLLGSPFKVRSAFRAHFGTGNGEGSSTGEGFRVAMSISSDKPVFVSKATQKFERELVITQRAASAKRSQSSVGEAEAE